MDVDIALEAATASDLGTRLERVFYFAENGVVLRDWAIDPQPEDDTRWYVPDGWDPNGVQRDEPDHEPKRAATSSGL